MRKAKTRRANSIGTVNEEGEGEEEDVARADSALDSLNMETKKFTESNMHLMQDKLNSSFMFDE